MSRMIMALLGGCLLASMSAHAATAARVHVVTIDAMQFGPMPTDVHAGDIIEWNNRDILEHSATDRDGHFDVDLKPGTSARTVAETGTFKVFCKFTRP